MFLTRFLFDFCSVRQLSRAIGPGTRYAWVSVEFQNSACPNSPTCFFVAVTQPNTHHRTDSIIRSQKRQRAFRWLTTGSDPRTSTVVSCHLISRHVVSFHFVSCRLNSFQIMSRSATSCCLCMRVYFPLISCHVTHSFQLMPFPLLSCVVFTSLNCLSISRHYTSFRGTSFHLIVSNFIAFQSSSAVFRLVMQLHFGQFSLRKFQDSCGHQVRS